VLETTEAELMQTVFPHPSLSVMIHVSVLDADRQALHFRATGRSRPIANAVSIKPERTAPAALLRAIHERRDLKEFR